MAIAVIGLVGVIAGALLGGLVSIYVDHLKEGRQALVAGRLISAELGTIKERMLGSAHSGRWWASDLPTEAWQTQRESLAALRAVNRSLDATIERAVQPSTTQGVNPASQSRIQPRPTATSTTVLIELAKLYATVVTWNGDRAASAAARVRRHSVPASVSHSAAVALPVQVKSDISATADAVERCRQYLDTALGEISTRLERRLARWALLVGVLIILVAGAGLGVASFAQRPDYTSETVATSLENYYGPSTLVTCDPAGIDWTCTVSTLNGTRRGCLAATTHAVSRPDTGRSPSSVTLAADSTAVCPVTGSTSQRVEPDGTDLALPGQAERNERGLTFIHGQTRNFWQKLTNVLFPK
jgi:hypothetical protein